MLVSISSLESSWLGALGRILFPPHMRCSLCGQPIEQLLDDSICPSCLATMPIIEAPYCPRCNLPGVVDSSHCPDCSHLKHSFTQSRSLWRYEENAKKAVQLFKFEKRIHLVVVLAQQIHEKLLCQTAWDYDIITYVPMHPKAERSRGYNQSEALARELASLVNVPCYGLLQKAFIQAPQHLLSREERLRSLQSNVFSISTAAKEENIVAKRILLIDDVLTTGVTAHVCSLKLLEAGASQVVVATIAR